MSKDADTGPRRDVRADYLGFLDEVWTQWRDPLADGVKSAMKTDEKVVGDLFQAHRVSGGSTVALDTDLLLGWYDRGLIARKEFLKMISPKLGEAQKVLRESEIKRLVLESRPKEDSLRIARLKGVEVKLIDAIRAVSREIGIAA